MTRKCSHCGNNGHNSRTCPNRGVVKLFGVRLTDGPIRKSASMGNLVAMSNNNNISTTNNPGSPHADDGYLSDGLVQASSSSHSRERKKGVPWSEEEHRMFLVGLQKLGKGDWRGIARNFVITRTPTQVASHAQKYFIRQSNMTRRKRRSSLFDIVPEPDSDAMAAAGAEEHPKASSVDSVAENSAKAPVSSLGVPENQLLSAVHTSCEVSNNMSTQPNVMNSMYQGTVNETNNTTYVSSHPVSNQEGESESLASTVKENEEAILPQGTMAVPCGIPVMFPGFMPPMVPFPLPVWNGFGPNAAQVPSNSNVVKPQAKILTAPLNVDEETGISKLSIGDTPAPIEPSDLSLKLLNRTSSQSAFHANPSASSSSFNPSSNVIHVN
eukprot:TRINITY_DN6529_c0_g1_i2.p1 TRINITY_DN6529_c0_g1~~TRINITY_DN6529_c0_g1_i2.p1  ORF type:complete len:383 (+),score=63.90 TRINITY_DN6529_c0_g1_i2:232-1380(+)